MKALDIVISLSLYIYIYTYNYMYNMYHVHNIQSTHDGSATFHTFDVCADMYVRCMCGVCAGCMCDVCAAMYVRCMYLRWMYVRFATSSLSTLTTCAANDACEPANYVCVVSVRRMGASELCMGGLY